MPESRLGRGYDVREIKELYGEDILEKFYLGYLLIMLKTPRLIMCASIFSAITIFPQITYLCYLFTTFSSLLPHLGSSVHHFRLPP